MRPALLGFLILLACASAKRRAWIDCLWIDSTNTVRFITSQNQRTEVDAETAALEECRTQRAKQLSRNFITLKIPVQRSR